MPAPAPDDLIDALAGLPPQPAQTLCARLGISQSTLSRRLARSAAQVLRIGRARATRYALARSLPSLGSHLPIHRIDADGRVLAVGTLHALSDGGCWCEAVDDALAAYQWGDNADGVHAGVPYFLWDIRPQGFLGRLLPKQRPELGLPDNLLHWHDDHLLIALARAGEDLAGELLIGDESLLRWQRQRTQAPLPATADTYAQLAAAVLAGEPAGSSAGGEQPKFAVTVADGDKGRRPVLVKFSPPRSTAGGQRWADLLVCEALALDTLAAQGFAAPAARIVVGEARTFLEVERFDRCGAHGRRPVLSLAALDAEYVGHGSGWSRVAAGLAATGRLPAAEAARIDWLDAFGALIGNHDRHLGNLALIPGPAGLRLAPVYDMLPMALAPDREGSVREGDGPPPVLPAGPQLIAAAIGYWSRIAADERISAPFRALATRRAGALAAPAGRNGIRLDLEG